MRQRRPGPVARLYTPGRQWWQLADLVIGVVLWRRRRRGE